MKLGRRRVRSMRGSVAVMILLIGGLIGSVSVDAHPWTGSSSWGSYTHLIGMPPHLSVGGTSAAWQRMLHATYGGYGSGLSPVPRRTDGVFKSVDRDLTLVYQAQAKAIVPSMMVDGIVGSQTWNFSRFFNLKLTDAYSYYREYCYSANGYTCGYRDPGVRMRYVDGYEVWLIDTWGCNGYVTIDHPSIPAQWFENCG